MKKKILILGTGGTIASVSTEEGLKPGTDVEELLKYVPEVEGLCELSMQQVMSLDSTNVRPADWITLVTIIENMYGQYDGFLILHGTDTMAYTAAALSYMIQNSGKPIVLTGSQRPMEHNRTDAKENIYQSIRYLIHEEAFGVNIVFAGKVIPGTRGRKCRSHSLEAFESADGRYRAEFKDETLYIHEWKEKEFAEAVFTKELGARVLVWKTAPGMNPEMLLTLADSFDAAVLEGFGLGGLPDIDGCDYFPVLKKLKEQNKILVVQTQVSYEGTDMSVYEVGKKYKDQLQVLEAGTMTTEAVYTKLLWLLGMHKDKDAVCDSFVKTIDGDLRK